MRLCSVILLLLVAASPVPAKDPPGVPPNRTWEVLAPERKDFAKLPLTGRIPNVWHKPDTWSSGYLTTKDQIAELWKALGQTEAVPEVDFTKETVVVFSFAAREPRVVTEKDGKINLSCAIAAGGKTYTLCFFPKATIDDLLKAQK